MVPCLSMLCVLAVAIGGLLVMVGAVSMDEVWTALGRGIAVLLLIVCLFWLVKALFVASILFLKGAFVVLGILAAVLTVLVGLGWCVARFNKRSSKSNFEGGSYE